MHVAWDSVSNERGTAIREIVNRMPKAYICAAGTNSYHKVVYRKKNVAGSVKKFTKVRTEYTRNPDIAISRTKGTTALVEERHWGKASEHIPVTFHVNTQLKLSETRKRISKSMFYCPNVVKAAQTAYSEGVEELLEELGKLDGEDEGEAQAFFTKLERFITDPWERTVRQRAPNKPLWWHKGIVKAHQHRRQLTKRWNKRDGKEKSMRECTTHNAWL